VGQKLSKVARKDPMGCPFPPPVTSSSDTFAGPPWGIVQSMLIDMDWPGVTVWTLVLGWSENNIPLHSVNSHPVDGTGSCSSI